MAKTKVGFYVCGSKFEGRVFNGMLGFHDTCLELALFLKTPTAFFITIIFIIISSSSSNSSVAISALRAFHAHGRRLVRRGVSSAGAFSCRSAPWARTSEALRCRRSSHSKVFKASLPGFAVRLPVWARPGYGCHGRCFRLGLYRADDRKYHHIRPLSASHHHISYVASHHSFGPAGVYSHHLSKTIANTIISVLSRHHIITYHMLRLIAR